MLNDLAEDAYERLQILSFLKNRYRTPKLSYTDQIYVYKNEDDRIGLLFIIKYKAFYKFIKEIFRAGLRFINVPKEIINRLTIFINL